MNRKSHKAKRDEKEQSEKHVHFWPMRIVSPSAKVNKQQDPISDCFHLMGGAGWEMVFLCCWSTFSCPWKNCGSVKGWNASQTVCALFLQNVCEERYSPPPQSKQPCRLCPWHSRSAQGSDPSLQLTPLSTPTSGARVSRDLPFATCPSPSHTFCLCFTLHAELPDLFLGTLIRSVFTGNFILDKAFLLKKEQMSFAT